MKKLVIYEQQLESTQEKLRKMNTGKHVKYLVMKNNPSEYTFIERWKEKQLQKREDHLMKKAHKIQRKIKKLTK